MKCIDKGFDNILNADYELYSIRFEELKIIAKGWYPGIKFQDFNIRTVNEYKEKEDQENLKIIKQAGTLTNLFFAYQENTAYSTNMYLLDGFNRLFTDYGDIKLNDIVYIKVIQSKLKDSELMGIMLKLNLWKISAKHHNFDTLEFFDRGFRLFLYSKFKIKISTYEDYQTRVRNECDFYLLDYYFRSESEMWDTYKLEYNEIIKIFRNERIVDDFREIINSNDYLEEPFKHYNKFLKGFVKFLSRRRIKGDIEKYEFQTFLKKLQEDKFYKKLKGMSGTDSTRKNIYNFFRNIEGNLK